MGYRTPNIDRVANEGGLFTDYYSQQSCTAGRACFITGPNPTLWEFPESQRVRAYHGCQDGSSISGKASTDTRTFRILVPAKSDITASTPPSGVRFDITEAMIDAAFRLPDNVLICAHAD